MSVHLVYGLLLLQFVLGYAPFEHKSPGLYVYLVAWHLNEWMTDNIFTLKDIRRKNELIWQKTRITINFNIYYDSCIGVEKIFLKENQN